MVAVEERVSGVEDTTTIMAKRLERLETCLKTVAIKNEDLEARGRCNNILILGVVETTDTGRKDIFVERLLSELFDRQFFTSPFVIERAHRSLGPRPVPGAPPLRARLSHVCSISETGTRCFGERGNWAHFNTKDLNLHLPTLNSQCSRGKS